MGQQAIDQLVTIGIPVYNGMPRIERAIKSALAQSHRPLQIVISDNASSDRTDAVCREYARQYEEITFLSNPENLGATRNFNRVYAAGEGPYFKWMGHDDVLDPSAVAKAVAILEDNPALAIAHWLERIVDDQEKILREYQPAQGFEITGGSGAQRFRQMLHWRRYGFAGDPIYGVIRRSALEQTRLLSSMHNPNFLLLEELAIAGGITTIPEVLSTRVYNDVRVTTRRLLNWLDPESNRSLPHFGRAREHIRIGLGAEGSTGDRMRTVGSLALFLLEWRELRGFAWDIAEPLRTRK
jgi:glycosyltransferase involved in cell wall biosynthesis